MMIAVRWRRIAVVNYLLECGADLAIESIDGETAMTVAKDEDAKEIIELLSRYDVS